MDKPRPLLSVVGVVAVAGTVGHRFVAKRRSLFSVANVVAVAV